ncbi:hypothetical protein KY290_031122 [Solanum tuberosum]|uniref:DUF4283 domain-containing protein n=1 Tax=Solanum tuberosum TaxID=4113 RepID=A0ABQ7U941_SOLTU|nr:hypothetical protein KY290_031122 [Solanum tuberosum]
MAQEAATKGNQHKGKKVQQLELQEEIKMGSESRETVNSKADVDKENQLAEQKAKYVEKENRVIAQKHWEEITQPQPLNLGSPSGSGSIAWVDEMEEVMVQKPKARTVWDTFDISKLAKVGFKLDYVVLEKHGEGSIIGIDLEDIESEVNYWNNKVVCYVLGAHPPFTVINGYIQRIWANYGLNKVVMLKNGVIIVRFDSVEGKEEVLKGGIYHFDNKPFIVKTWSMDREFTKEELIYVPIWIKLPGLDFKYWSPIGLSKIGKKVYFKNVKGQVIEQQVVYDWKPTHRTFYDKHGHTTDECRTKNPAKKKGVTKEYEEHGQLPTQACQSSEGQEAKHVELRTGETTKVQVGQHHVEHGEPSSVGWITPFKTGRNQGSHQVQVASNNSFQTLNKSNELNSPTPRIGQTVGGRTIFLEGNG